MCTGKLSPRSCLASASAFLSSRNAPTWTQWPPGEPPSTGAPCFGEVRAFAVSGWAPGADLAVGAGLIVGATGSGAVPTGRSAGLGAAGAGLGAVGAGAAGGLGASALAEGAGGAGVDGGGAAGAGFRVGGDRRVVGGAGAGPDGGAGAASLVWVLAGGGGVGSSQLRR